MKQSLQYDQLLVLLLCGFNGIIFSQDNPVQFSLFNPIQNVPENEFVNGTRLNLIYSSNVNVTGFVNISRSSQSVCNLHL